MSAHPLAHRFLLSTELRASLEAQRFRGKWADVRGIVDDNDHLMKAHGFALPDGTWQQLPSLP
eukprot:CAMPEP_0194525488 /NCGR_PEP_ID=MMETSP0253-20130528/60978_1 /TAXON_ID=2966 /ORGANISM="Noctiluca scintillans" /LENGTH=62 /DNA_ID=CAMNT_0039370223 /DNA_START=1 /DNA_END=185 /DNA_ORIENTATION=+